MCDYSLETYRSRPAQVGERYETRRFPSSTVGTVSPGDPSTAVCIACDTRLRLEGIPEEVRKTFGVMENEDVLFTRLEHGPHHDGVVFSNGAEVSLQLLGAGVQITLLQPSEPRRETETATDRLVPAE